MTYLPTMIDSEWLITHHACSGELTVFEKEWPNGGTVTKRSLTRAAELGLDLEWFVNKTMPDLFDDKYMASVVLLYSEYEAKCIPMYAEYLAKLDPIYAEYLVKRDQIYAEHKRNTDLIYAEYKTKSDRIYAEYEAKRDQKYAEYQVKVNVLVLYILLGQCTN